MPDRLALVDHDGLRAGVFDACALCDGFTHWLVVLDDHAVDVCIVFGFGYLLLSAGAERAGGGMLEQHDGVLVTFGEGIVEVFSGVQDGHHGEGNIGGGGKVLCRGLRLSDG